MFAITYKDVARRFFDTLDPKSKPYIPENEHDMFAISVGHRSTGCLFVINPSGEENGDTVALFDSLVDAESFINTDKTIQQHKEYTPYEAVGVKVSITGSRNCWVHKIKW